MKFNPDESVERGGEPLDECVAAAGVEGQAGGQAGAGQKKAVGPPVLERPRLMKRLAVMVILFVIVSLAVVVGLAVTSRPAQQQKGEGAVPDGKGGNPAGAQEGQKSAALARMESDMGDAGPDVRGAAGGGELKAGDGARADAPSQGPPALRSGPEPASIRDGSFQGAGDKGFVPGQEGGLYGQRITGRGVGRGEVSDKGQETEAGDKKDPASPRTVSTGVGGRQTVSIRYAPVPVERAAVPAAAGQGAAEPAAKGEFVLPPYDTQLPVTLVGTFFSPASSSTTVRMALSSTVSGDGWELPRGTLVLGRAGRVTAGNRVEVTVIGIIDPARNRFVRMGGEVTDQYGAAGLAGVLMNRKSLVRRAGSVAMGLVPGVAGAIAHAYVYPAGTLVPGSASTSRPNEYVEVAAGAQGFVMVRDIPEGEPGKDADGQLTPEEMEIIRSLRAAQGARAGGGR